MPFFYFGALDYDLLILAPRGPFGLASGLATPIALWYFPLQPPRSLTGLSQDAAAVRF